MRTWRKTLQNCLQPHGHPRHQNSENSFKGVCSNAQFFIEDGGLKNTEQNQRYVFIWSAVYNAESPELSVDHIQYSAKQPKNIQVWLQEKI